MEQRVSFSKQWKVEITDYCRNQTGNYFDLAAVIKKCRQYFDMILAHTGQKL